VIFVSKYSELLLLVFEFSVMLFYHISQWLNGSDHHNGLSVDSEVSSTDCVQEISEHHVLLFYCSHYA
jgi:hypothetical protein